MNLTVDESRSFVFVGKKSEKGAKGVLWRGGLGRLREETLQESGDEGVVGGDW